jgi:hypothetical protein
MCRYQPLSRPRRAFASPGRLGVFGAAVRHPQFLSVTRIVEDRSARTSTAPTASCKPVVRKMVAGHFARGLFPRASLRHRTAAVARYPNSKLWARGRTRSGESSPREGAQSGVVRGGSREPISRQPPRADLPRDLPTNSWHRQEPAKARLGVTGSPAHEFLQISLGQD